MPATQALPSESGEITSTVPENGISGGRKCNTTNCIPYEAASKMDHFDEIKTIISRKNKKIFDIL